MDVIEQRREGGLETGRRSRAQPLPPNARTSTMRARAHAARLRDLLEIVLVSGMVVSARLET
jgi:hypothetical protein